MFFITSQTTLKEIKFKHKVTFSTSHKSEIHRMSSSLEHSVRCILFPTLRLLYLTLARHIDNLGKNRSFLNCMLFLANHFNSFSWSGYKNANQ